MFSTYRCTQNLLTKLGLNNTPAGELKAHLQQIDAKQLIHLNFYQNSFEFFGSREFGFVPTVDDRFVWRAPHSWLLGNHTDVTRIPQRPLLIGSTTVESLHRGNFAWNDVRWPPDSDWPTDSPYGRRADIMQLLAALMKIPDEPRPDLTEDVLMLEGKKINLFFDSMSGLVEMKYSIWRFAQRYQLLTGGCRPIVYQFAFDGAFGEFRAGHSVTASAEGPIHGDDLGYLFGRRSEVMGDGDDDVLADAQAVSKRLVSMWADFIKSM